MACIARMRAAVIWSLTGVRPHPGTCLSSGPTRTNRSAFPPEPSVNRSSVTARAISFGSGRLMVLLQSSLYSQPEPGDPDVPINGRRKERRIEPLAQKIPERLVVLGQLRDPVQKGDNDLRSYDRTEIPRVASTTR